MTDFKNTIKTFSYIAQCYSKCGWWSGADPSPDHSKLNSTENETKYFKTIIAIREWLLNVTI